MLRGNRGDAAGAESGSYSNERITGNTGTAAVLSFGRATSSGVGMGSLPADRAADGAEPP